MPPGQRPQRSFPAERTDEIGDHDGQPAAPWRPAELFQRHRKITAFARTGPRGRRQRAEQMLQVRPAAAGGDPGQSGSGRHHSADPVATAPGQVADGRRGRDHQVALLAADGAEVQGRRQVGDQPGLQLPVRHRLPDVRFGGAGRDGPVHPSDVIAGVVQPGVPELGARAGHQAEVVALQQAVQTAPDGEFQGRQGGIEPRRVRCARCGPGWFGIGPGGPISRSPDVRLTIRRHPGGCTGSPAEAEWPATTDRGSPRPGSRRPARHRTTPGGAAARPARRR